jgi:hypothetical protein
MRHANLACPFEAGKSLGGDTKMKGHEFQRLQNAIQSLGDSTFVRYASGGIGCEVNGRCSTYISHRSVTFGESTVATRTAALVGNDKYTLVVGRSFGQPQITEVLGNRGASIVVEAQIPRQMIEGILASLRTYLAWDAGSDPLVWVTFGVARVVRWDGAKPVFADPEPMPEPQAEEGMPCEYTEYVDLPRPIMPPLIAA